MHIRCGTIEAKEFRFNCVKFSFNKLSRCSGLGNSDDSQRHIGHTGFFTHLLYIWKAFIRYNKLED